MYIIFDDNGGEYLRYFLTELPDSLKSERYVELESEDEIPKRDGYIERARLEDGELVWEYEEINSESEYDSEVIDKLIKDNAEMKAALDILLGGELNNE